MEDNQHLGNWIGVMVSDDEGAISPEERHISLRKMQTLAGKHVSSSSFYDTRAHHLASQAVFGPGQHLQCAMPSLTDFSGEQTKHAPRSIYHCSLIFSRWLLWTMDIHPGESLSSTSACKSLALPWLRVSIMFVASRPCRRALLYESGTSLGRGVPLG